MWSFAEEMGSVRVACAVRAWMEVMVAVRMGPGREGEGEGRVRSWRGVREVGVAVVIVVEGVWAGATAGRFSWVAEGDVSVEVLRRRDCCGFVW